MSGTEAGNSLAAFLFITVASGTFIMGTPFLMYTMYPFLLWRKHVVETQLI